MTADSNKCSLRSLFPMSCQRRAETFARRLHHRLRSLGSTESEPANENTWLAASENSVTSSQPRHTDPDLYYDFGTLESPPGSPEEETYTQEIENVINEDNLTLLLESKCSCSMSDENSDSGNESKTTTCDNQIMCNLQSFTKESLNGHTETEDTNSNKNHTTEDCREINPNEEMDKNSLEGTLPSSEDVLKLNTSDAANCNGTSLSQLNCNNNDTSKTLNTKENYWPKQETINSISQQSDEDSDDMEDRIPRVRRCSSLKTGKTPPGTPSRKKIVRFADVLGLDLADVRTFLDEIPKIPNSAYNDLKEADLNEPSVTNTISNTTFQGAKITKILVPLFQQPGGQPEIIDRVRENQVCLDTALVDDPIMLSITGTVRVKNLDFHKSVHIRYTLDSWQTFADVQATYVENSCDGFSDKFSFMLFANTLPVGQKLEFAIRFQCRGCQYWDNNRGANYGFQCLPPTDTITTQTLAGVGENWNENLYY